MLIFNTHEAKTHFSKLIDKVLSGQEVIIGRAGKPVVKLVAFNTSQKPRSIGALKGKIWMSEDFIQEDEEINKLFYGKDT